MTGKLVIAAAAALGLAACNSGGGAASGSASESASGAPAATAPSASTETSADLGPGGMPRQRVGLWRMAMTMAPGMPAINQEVCVTPQMATDAANMARPQGIDAQCDPTRVQRDGDAIVGATTCRMNGQPVTSRFRLTGDTQSRYQMEVTSEGVGPASTVRVDATYVGPCQG